MATNTTVTVAATSTEIRPALTGRLALTITNEGAAKIYLAEGEAAVVGSGIPLPPGATWEMPQANESFNAWNGIAVSGTCSVAVHER